jgi:hypothetical protein
MSKKSHLNPRDSGPKRVENTREERRTGQERPFVSFNFKDFEGRNQGQTFEIWEKEGLLALAMNRLTEISRLRVGEATTPAPNSKRALIKIYRQFPPDSVFKCPPMLKDKTLSWASIHIQGKECIAGYMDENNGIFYLVFLDKEHEFWPSTR